MSAGNVKNVKNVGKGYYAFSTFLALFTLLTFLLWASPSPKVEQAWKAYRESRLEEAERLWQEALREDPYTSDAEKGLSQIRRERFSLTSSEPYVEAIRELYEVGMKAFRKSHWTEAEEALARADALAPRHPQILRQLEEVREKMRKELPVTTPTVEVSTHQAPQPTSSVTLVAPSKPVETVTRPRKAHPVSVDPAQVDDLYATGMKAYRRKQYQEALQWWRKVLALDPLHEKALKNVQRLEQEVEPGLSPRAGEKRRKSK